MCDPNLPSSLIHIPSYKLCCPTIKKMDDDLLPDVVGLDLIEDGLYLGNLTAAVDFPTLRSYRVSHILTVDNQPLPASITSLQGMHFMYINVDDMSHEDLLSHFEDAVSFIKDGQEKGNVLVHCYFGVSRSATLVTCFLMKKYKLSLDEALQRVKSRRYCIGPNPGFLEQLALYQTMGWDLIEDNKQYRLYKLQVAARSVKKGASLGSDNRLQDITHPDPNTASDCGPVAYKCRSCRLSVICLKSIIPHCPSKTPMWTDAKWTEKEAELTLCDKGIFTFPISWMGDTTQTLQGKLLCPKCQAKLGSFSWCKGLLMVLCNLLHRFLVSTWTKVLHLHILQDLSFFCKMAYAYEFSLHALFIFALCLHKARMLLHKSPLSHFSLVQNPNSQEF
ncbi:dual specificity protein phosphatase MPK-4-like isoform X1 [Eriocheir sinensis]|uniref:dual specificity protein phosphatase MPK-4-like isoform X1 n=1 Tax=Eriocheir sinensis TaxID=95602 RepID=UPI0021CA12CC|nr:dual specificity protein phosphatase MPK-4-like isoform X1 [Eriocheir sinensis]